MDTFDDARDLYRDGKLLLDATRDLALTSDRVRWTREDLEEDLLDLKLAVIDLNFGEIETLSNSIRMVISIVYEMLLYPPDESEET